MAMDRRQPLGCLWRENSQLCRKIYSGSRLGPSCCSRAWPRAGAFPSAWGLRESTAAAAVETPSGMAHLQPVRLPQSGASWIARVFSRLSQLGAWLLSWSTSLAPGAR